MNDKCEDCRFYYQDNSEKGGICRRCPPKVIGAGNSTDVFYETIWPWVGNGEWCGEFKAKPEPEQCKHVWIESGKNWLCNRCKMIGDLL